MVYLHYRHVGDLDWPALVRDASGHATDVVLVVPRVTLQEIDKHKNGHTHQTIRERAQRVLRWLDAQGDVAREAGHAPVRDGVTLAFAGRPISVDFAAAGLDPAQGDDQLVAVMLAYRAADSDADIWLVTQDSGPRATARDHGFRTLALPDALKLPPEEDPHVKENRQLKRELEAMKHARPRLALTFVPGRGVVAPDRVELMLDPDPVPPEAVWAAALAAAEAAIPVRTPEADAAAAAARQLAAERSGVGNAARVTIWDAYHETPTLEEYARYAEERSKRLTHYDRALREEWVVWVVARRRFTVRLELANTGGAPAEDVDVHVHVPDGPDVEAGDGEGGTDRPLASWQPPAPPAAPAPPRGVRELQIDQLRSVSALAMPTLPDLSFLRDRPIASAFAPAPNVSSVSVRKTNSYDLAWKVRRLKHGTTVALPPFTLDFPPEWTAGGFTMACRLHPMNLPEPSTASLHVVVRPTAQGSGG